MTARWTGVLIALALAVPMARAQDLLPPPVPSGPPIVLAGSAILDDTPPSGRPTITATVAETPFLDNGLNLSGAHPRHPTPPPAGFVSSACNFNPWCGDNIFSPDFSSCQVLLGGYFSSKLGPKIPSFSYVPFTLRQGWMLNAPAEHESKWRGCWEFLCDITAAPIVSSYGSYLFGPSFLLRYNFVQPDAALVPYFQTGPGFVISDAYKDRSQGAIGQAFEFYLHAEFGLHYFLSNNWAIDLEGGLQHISNARLAKRNLGVNAFGFSVGVTYYFPSGGR